MPCTCNPFNCSSLSYNYGHLDPHVRTYSGTALRKRSLPMSYLRLPWRSRHSWGAVPTYTPSSRSPFPLSPFSMHVRTSTDHTHKRTHVPRPLLRCTSRQHGRESSR
jgi:hypothetical protein